MPSRFCLTGERDLELAEPCRQHPKQYRLPSYRTTSSAFTRRSEEGPDDGNADSTAAGSGSETVDDHDDRDGRRLDGRRGVFSLPRRFAQETGVAGALIAWAIAGAGMLMLAFVFQTLAIRKPELDAGVYAYAKAGFGEYLGFFSAFGYWASAASGNVTYWVLIMSTIGAVVAGARRRATACSRSCCRRVGLWVFFLLIRRGIKEAAAINRIVTVAKLVPIIVFILLWRCSA